MSASVVPGRASRAKLTGSTISRTICNGSPVASSSSVVGTEPSTEFSIGTTALSHSPRRTASRAAATEACGCRSARDAAGRVLSAASANVPAGPR